MNYTKIVLLKYSNRLSSLIDVFLNYLFQHTPLHNDRMEPVSKFYIYLSVFREYKFLHLYNHYNNVLFCCEYKYSDPCIQYNYI